MTTPYFSALAAIVYFGWLWHGRSAADRSEGGALNRPAKEPRQTGQIPAPQRAPVESVTAKPFDLEDISTAAAQGGAQ